MMNHRALARSDILLAAFITVGLTATAASAETTPKPAQPNPALDLSGVKVATPLAAQTKTFRIPIATCPVLINTSYQSNYIYAAQRWCRVDVPNGSTIKRLRAYAYTGVPVLRFLSTKSSKAEIFLQWTDYAKAKTGAHGSNLGIHGTNYPSQFGISLKPGQLKAETIVDRENKKDEGNDFYLRIVDHHQLDTSADPRSPINDWNNWTVYGGSLVNFAEVVYEIPN